MILFFCGLQKKQGGKRMMGRIKKTFIVIITMTLVLGVFSSIKAIKAINTRYEIYPEPHKITYQSGDFILKDQVNVVYEKGIDLDTQNRLKEVTDLKGLSVTTANQINAKMTNILVGIKGSNGYVDNYVKEHGSYAADLFDQLDAYYMQVKDGTIVILAKDSDAAFYGLTTLYLVIKQLESLTINNFTIEDYSDVASRGFIEGYYGNPWSTKDRVDLMKWGGYYKLNSYFYAPKDDPKHNSKWRELYTPEEIETKIKPLAKAGNESKCRFVFALHPFMNSPISFTKSKYQNDLAILQAKFEQVIKVGVRQIAILADDAANFNGTGDLGGNNYRRLLEDMTKWLKTLQKDYPDLKLTLPFCPVEYGGNGQNYYRDFPENVQIIMTGGKVWGEVSNKFTTTFTKNTNRGPYMWINWPCTDNSKKHLIMGGYDTFLQPGVEPKNIQGIVLNPMQQSQPSKVAIFGNACYSWHIWDSKEKADQTWENSFKYVDHNSPIDTDASKALKELSKHMINQAMDGRVTALQESVVLKDKLNRFKTKLANDSIDEKDIDELIDEFKILQTAVATYRLQGNKEIKDQIIYWLDCYDDTTLAAIAYLNGIKAILNNDTNGILQFNNEGKAAFDRSKTHGFNYVNHLQYAEVGVQHIVPFIKTMALHVSKYAQIAMDPEKIVKTFITNRQDTPVGNLDNVFDGKDNTNISYQSPAQILKDDYVGVKFNKNIDIENLRFLLGNGKNHFDRAKLQYSNDGKDWQDLKLVKMKNEFIASMGKYLEVDIKKENLPKDFKAMAIRLLAMENNQLDAYLNVHEIQINKADISGKYSTNRDLMNETDFNVLMDGQNGNNGNQEIWLSVKTGNDRDKLPKDSYLAYTFASKQKVSAVYFAQGGSANNDVIKDGLLQYLDDDNKWQTINKINSDKVQTFDLSLQDIETTALRILNNKTENVWWRIGEFRVEVDNGINKPLEYNIIKTNRWQVHQGPETNLFDGKENTFVWYDPDGKENTTNDDFLENDFIGYDFKKIALLDSVHIVVGSGDKDKITKYAIETSLDNQIWTPIKGYDNYQGKNSGKDIIDIKLDGLKARYIRIRNLKRQDNWGKFSEFTVKEVETGTLDYVYTNVDQIPVLSFLKEGTAWLTPAKVSLKPNQYIGIDLKNIKHINDLDVSDQGLKLQVSKNEIEWFDYNDLQDARYIRLINLTDQTANLDLTKLKVSFNYIGDKKVESNFANNQAADDMRSANTVNNVFDGNLATIGMINGPQEAGKQITFDLGQVIDFKSIRYYINENQMNYLRDASFEVSVDGHSWDKVVHVGKKVDNVFNTTTAKDMQNITLYHDNQNPGYMYQEATGLNVKGRYLKVTPTSSYSHRWVGFNEIQINGGTYLSPEVNRDIISDAVEEKGKIPSNMIDKDYTTSYRSSKANSSFTYHISKPKDLRTVRIVQIGKSSNAKVTGHVYHGQEIKTIDLGTLNQTISEFVIPEGMVYKDIQVAWEENIPEILEIALYKEVTDVTKPKETLKALLANQQDVSNWTSSSVERYQSAYQVGKEVYDNPYASKDSIEMAIGLLNGAINNVKEKYTDSKLATLIKQAITNDNGYYTVISYNNYSFAISSGKAGLENIDDLSKADGQKLVSEIEKAQENLVYSMVFREQAQLLVDEELALGDDIYSKETLSAYQKAKDALTKAIVQDKEATDQKNRVAPATFKQLIDEYHQAKQQLEISAKATLQALIDELATYNSELYEPASFTAYQEAVNKGKEIINHASNNEIVAQIKEILAQKALLKGSQKGLEALIKEMEELDGSKYTETSYQNLMAVVAKAKEVKDENEFANYIQALINAKIKLVNVDALNKQIAIVNALDSNLYTKASYQLVKDALKQSQIVLKNGSQEDVDAMIQSLINAVNQLELSGLQEYQKYMHTIDLKSDELYTPESYQIYLEAYNNLKNLGDDISLKDFITVKTRYEEAIQALKFKGANYNHVHLVLNQIPDDLSGFDQIKVKELQMLIASIDYNLTVNDQAKVDQYAKNLQSALNNVLASINSKPDTTTNEDKNKVNLVTAIKTGDEQVIYPFLIMIFLSGLGLFGWKKKKVN